MSEGFSGSTNVATPHGFKTLERLVREEKDKFLIYAWDFGKEDYTLAWAHSPQKTGRAKTLRIVLDNGMDFLCTPDRRVMLKSQEWAEAGSLKFASELMPFYRLPARQGLTQNKINQFPRIYTNQKGWIHERQFVDEWAKGKPCVEMQKVNRYCQMMSRGLTFKKIMELTRDDTSLIQERLERAGFSSRELKWLGSHADHRRVVGTWEHEEMDVYELKAENYCTEWGVVHE